jgi:hypothetical protein
MANELRRFLHLERARPASGAAEPSQAPTQRFAGVERPGEAAPQEATPTGVQLDRFGPDPEPSLELAPADADARPFTRCPRCGMDHGLHARACSRCGAPLDGEDARAFNDRLWAERRAEAAREAEAAAKRAATQADVAQDRRLLEALAREVGDAERRRLSRDGWADVGGWSGAPDLRVVLVYLFRSGWLVRLALAGIALLALALAARARGLPAAPLVPLVVLALLFPSRRRWR